MNLNVPPNVRVTGSLVGGNIAEEIVPVSIADFFVIDKKVWLKFQKDQAKSTADGSSSAFFNKSRSALILGEYQRSMDAAWKIKQFPEGVFQYTADLAFSFKTNIKGMRDVKRKNVGRSLLEQLSNGWNGTEEVTGLRSDIARDECDSVFDNSNRSTADNSCNNKRKLFGSDTTHERESLIGSLSSFLKTKTASRLDPPLRSFELSEEMVIHEVSFLNTILGIATTQHIVQTQKRATIKEVGRLIITSD